VSGSSVVAVAESTIQLIALAVQQERRATRFCNTFYSLLGLFLNDHNERPLCVPFPFNPSHRHYHHQHLIYQLLVCDKPSWCVHKKQQQPLVLVLIA
jgi:hypothetical protein